MKYKIFILMTFAFCGLSTLVKATGQIGEKIIIGRDTLWMLTRPLAADTILSRKVCEQIDQEDLCSVFRRWYIGTWRLENEVLYLEEIKMFNGTRIKLDGIFDDYRENGRIAARWFSGKIRVVRGKQIYSNHMSLTQYYEYETIYMLCDGVVKEKEEMHNSFRKGRNDEYDYTLNVLFNGKGMKWEGDSSLDIEVILKPNGKTGRVKVFSWNRHFKSKQNFASAWADFEIEEKQYGRNHPYVREIKKCLDLMDGWPVLVLDGKIQPVRLGVKWGRDRSEPYKHWLPHELRQMDSIKIDGRDYVFIYNPLQQDADVMTHLRPRLKGAFTTRTLRGYIARWKIADGRLWLTELRHGVTGKLIPLSTLVLGCRDKSIVASWYTGSFEVSMGEGYFGYTEGREIIFEVRDGQVIHQTVYDNYIQPGDTAAYGQFIRTIHSHDWASYSELENRSLHGDFMVYPDLNGVADSIKNIRLYVNGDSEKDRYHRVITDPADPWIGLVRRAAESVSRWEVWFIKGKVGPLWISFEIKQPEQEKRDLPDGPLRVIHVSWGGR